MKKKNFVTRLLGTMLALAICMTSVPVSANSTQTMTTAGNSTVEVTTASKNGTGGSDKAYFIVSLPAKLYMTSTGFGQFSVNYQIGVKAILNETQSVTVTPGALTLTGKTNGQPITATVNQAIKTWKLTGDDRTSKTAGINEFANVDGSISATITSQDTYEGNLTFTIALNE